MVVQVLVAMVETFIYGKLGTEALAGFALVFPLMMMMTMMAAGGMGGGVAAAMARATGGGRHDDARSLVVHAGALAVVMSIVFSVFAWTAAPALFRLLGGTGQALANAEIYSHVLFTCSLAIWVNFFLSSLLRGGGDAATPGRFMLLSSICQVPLSYVLALGIGSWSGIGMAGPAYSMLITSTVSALLQVRALWSGKLGFVPKFRGVPLQRRLFWDILRVGLISSFSALTANLTAMMVTGLVGRFGVAALAGYGIGVRLEFMLVPLAFGIGSGLTTLVARGARGLDRQSHLGRPHRRAGLARGAAARRLGAAVHRRATGDRRDRFLHHACRPLLFPFRYRHDAQLREPGHGPHEGTVLCRHRPPDRGDDGRLVCRRPTRLGPQRRVHRHCRRHGHLRRRDHRAAVGETLGTETC